MSQLIDRRAFLAFGVALVAFAATAGTRLLHQSSDPHFVLQADAWLHGRLSIDDWPVGPEDPSQVDEVRLDDGSITRGRPINTRGSFRTFAGEEFPQTRIQAVVKSVHYVSSPPFPALLFLPQVLFEGRLANDVVPTVLLAALAPAFLLVLFDRLRQVGLLRRPPNDDLWFAALLAFGTVFYVSAVQGRVWFTAHVVAVDLTILYAFASIEARHPVLAGVFLGLAFATRTPMLFAFPLFLLEALRVERERLGSRLFYFAAPVVLVGLVLAALNVARFGEPAEFGHSYLVVRQQMQIERYGLFSLHYLSRNLAVALALLPELRFEPPWISLSGHGMAIWVTTPAVLLLLQPAERGVLHRPLYLTVALVAACSLLYQNSGWLQFGYRFSLDYMVFLVMLLALSGRELTRLLQAAIVVGIVVNFFGAVTFGRLPAIYRTDRVTYEQVIPNG
jgi:hypothetical protein